MGGSTDERVLLHRQALRDADAVVRGLDGDDLAAPSRCDGWSVRDLLEHMVGQNVGFAEAIGTGDAPVESYRPRPAHEWERSVSALESAVARGVPAARLVEVAPDAELPLASVLAIHALDLVVHAWDAVGPAYRPAPALLGLVGAVARRTPPRTAPGGAFAPAVEGGDDGDDWHRVLRLLGRRP